MRKNQIEFLTEGAGWIGVLSILCAYALLSFEVVSAQSLWYHGLNVVGGIGIIIDGLADKNYQPVVLNLIWMGIGGYAISQILF